MNYRWITIAEYNDQEGYVVFKFNEAIEPLITSLEKHFTSYAMESVNKLSSIYSIRLYELIVSWKNASKMPTISLEDLRFKLGVGKNFKSANRLPSPFLSLVKYISLPKGGATMSKKFKHQH